MVGPRVSGELLAYGMIGLMLAIFAILIYLWFRFEWQFALGAMIANVHDIVLTIGFMSITQVDFDLTSIAALLTILGYSLNDTVVIYDRIREMLRRYKKMPMPQLLNESINSTLSRSIITHVTVTLALAGAAAVRRHAIHSFTAVMMFGVVLVGTYTSIFIAAPILIYLGVGTNRTMRRTRRPRRSSHGRILGRPASSEVGADRGLRQGRLCLRRHVASRFAAVPAGRDLGLAGDQTSEDRRDTRWRGSSSQPMPSTRLIVGTGTDVWVPPTGTAARRCARCGWCWTRCRPDPRSAPTTSCWASGVASPRR